MNAIRQTPPTTKKEITRGESHFLAWYEESEKGRRTREKPAETRSRPITMKNVSTIHIHKSLRGSLSNSQK
jgi:hypothetical protein